MIELPQTIFREYDIRGIAATDLRDEVLRVIGRAYADTIRAAGGARVGVGRDCRLSSPRIAATLSAAIRAGGVDVVDIGMVPSPLLYFAVHSLKLDGGIQVTGSHNPPEYNGLKLLVGVEAIYGEAIRELQASAAAGLFGTGDGPGSETQKDILPEYLAYCGTQLRRVERPLRVVVDAANGAAGPTAIALYNQLGVDVVELNTTPDGTFPVHHPDPTIVAHLEYLGAAVREHGADFGIGFDGDGDRIGVVDEAGEIIWGDRLMVLLSRALLAERPGATVLGEVKCSKVLYDAIEDAGGVAVMGRVGHSIMKSEMTRLSAPLAGEMSGHIFYSDRFLGFDDASYVGARVMEILGDGPESLSERLADLPVMFSTPEIRVDCDDDEKFGVVERLIAAAPAGVEQCLIDGLRLTWPDGWGLVRASNTQPALVVRAEAETETRCQEIQTDIERMIERVRVHRSV